MFRLLSALALALLLPSAHAETVNCTNITSLPATITTQGVYCLKQDLSTAVTAGSAITVAVNNVTIDCNGYKLGGLAAGAQTRAYGIYAENRVNTVIRNCSIRGFYVGAWMQGGAGHVIEQNRFDGNTYAAIGIISSDADLLRDNYIVDTGGNLPLATSPFGAAFGIGAQGVNGIVAVSNTVINTQATAGSGRAALGVGIITGDGVVEGNRVGNVLADGAGQPVGIQAANGRFAVRGNSVVNSQPVTGTGISASGSVCKDNLVLAYSTPMSCTDGGGNSSN